MSEQVETADLEIRRLFFSAPKAFAYKHWPAHEAGVGLAIKKLEKINKPTINIKVIYDEQVFSVPRSALLEKIKQRDCYNKNGSFVCGYVTRNGIYSLARALKKDKQSD